MSAVVEIVSGPLPPLEPAPARSDAGAEIVFHGRVRDSEADEPIVALFYEHYEGMAERELRRLAGEAIDRFGLLDLRCLHRVGEVKVGEPSLRVAIRSRHRAEGIEALEWFVRTLKVRVPIWKWGVTADGRRFPSSAPQGPMASLESDPGSGNHPTRRTRDAS